LDFYIPAVRSLTEEEAWRKSNDGRPIALVVAHIMAWEEWQIQVFTDPDKKQRLAQQMKLRSYYDPENDPERINPLNFETVDDFNTYQAEKYKSWIWQDIQEKAIKIALDLRLLFPQNPPEGWVEFLESTDSRDWQILPNKTITVPAGWYLWMVSLKHEAVTHRQDLI